MLIKKTFLSLLLLTALASCAHVKIPDTEACAVAGTMAAGMNCATTLSLKTREMDLDETLEFLEAQEAVKDENGKVIKEAHSAAICQTAKDYVSIKTALEQACIVMKKKCTYEIKQTIKKLGKVMEKIIPDIKKVELAPQSITASESL